MFSSWSLMWVHGRVMTISFRVCVLYYGCLNFMSIVICVCVCFVMRIVLVFTVFCCFVCTYFYCFSSSYFYCLVLFSLFRLY